MTLRRPSILLAVALLAGSASTVAQEGAGDRSSLWSLPLLRGRLINISYTAGSLDRAVRLQEKFERLSERVSGWTGRKTPLALYVLSREEWERVGFTLPYGFPGRFPMQILALPAWGDEGTVELWAGLMQGQAPAGDPALQRGGPEEVASLRVTDLLAQLEATRVLLESAALTGAELWTSELLAHSVLLSAWQRDESADADRMERLVATLRPAGSAPLALDEYRPGVAMDDWMAFQAAFHEGARVLARKRGPKAGRTLIKMARKGGGRLSGEALLARFPDLAAWHRSTFAATAAR